MRNKVDIPVSGEILTQAQTAHAGTAPGGTLNSRRRGQLPCGLLLRLQHLRPAGTLCTGISDKLCLATWPTSAATAATAGQREIHARDVTADQCIVEAFSRAVSTVASGHNRNLILGSSLKS